MYGPSVLRWLAVAMVALVPMAVVGNVALPQNDPFYYPPKGWQNKQPGDILRSRKIQAASVGAIPFHLYSWQVLYRSNANSPNEPSYTVTTILVPHGADKSKLVAFSSPENAVASKCAPSHLFRYTGVLDLNNFEPRWEQLLYLTFLEEGWVITAPDHEGPNNAFGAGRSGAHMVLDAIRATLKHKEVGMSKNAQVIGHGYSGGAVPNGWAAGLQPHYAPELNMAGWSLGGTPADMNMTTNFLNGGVSAGIVIGGVTGLMNAYPEVNKTFYEKIFTKAGLEAAETARNECIYELVFRFYFADFMGDKYTKNATPWDSHSAIRNVYNELRMGANPKFTPKAPVFMFHAAYDEEIVWYQANNTAVWWCNNGANIRFLTETSTDMNHVYTYLTNVPYIFNFMKDRFDGKPYYGGGCQFDTMAQDPIFDPSILGERFKELMQSLLDLIGKEIGPGDKILRQKIKEKKNPNRVGLVHIPALKVHGLTSGEGGNKTIAAKAKANSKGHHSKSH